MTVTEHWRTLDKNGMMMPWYTRPCLEWLETLDLKDKFVFEYGCGASSAWFKSRGAICHGVDHLVGFLPNEVGYYLEVDEIPYGASIDDGEGTLFDIVVIDGIHRDYCTDWALSYLRRGGYLIADNFEQPSADLAHWPKTRELTKHLPLTIYKEEGHEDWKTAVWQYV